MLVYFDTEPPKVTYEPQPDGTANVYIRKDIEKFDETYQDGTGQETTVTRWKAEEKNFQTTMSKADVEASADELFYSQGEPPTVEERLAAAEDTIAALMEQIAALEGGGE